LVNIVGFTKHKPILNKFLIHIIIIFSVNISFSQDLYDHQLDENKWSDIKEGIRYENEEGGGSSEWTFESKKQYQKWKKNKKVGNGNGNGGGNGYKNHKEKQNNSYENNKIKPKSNSNFNFNPPNLKGLSWIGWVILIAFLAGVIYLIIKYILDNNKGKQKVTAINYIEDDVAPSEIPLTELQRLLKEALDQENYRAAIRIYYLFILKDLSAKHWIEWQKEKTNMHYLYEMQKQSEYDNFSQTVSYFEIVWYGKRDIDKTQFNKIQPSFTNLLDQLGVK